MAQPTPPIDKRDAAAILTETRELVPFYTPEWRAAEDTGAGGALLRVFARIMEGLILRLNEVPRNNFIAFLEMLAVKLLPAQPARVPLTFALSTGAQEATEIPQRTQAAATPPEGGDPILFETEKPILATPAQLQAVFSVVPDEDQIFDHSSDLLGSATAQLFADGGKNQQEHSLYLGHADLFNVKSRVRIELTISPPPSSNLEKESRFVDWQYWGEKEVDEDGQTVKVTDWHPFDGATIETSEPEAAATQGKLVLKKDNDDEIQPLEINGVESRWIRCKVKATKIKDVRDVAIDTLKVRVTPLADENGSSAIAPDMAFYNDTELDLTKPFYPFGTRPRLFDTFYLASQEAFSKKGATAGLMVSLCRVSVRAPRLRFSHAQGEPVTKVSFREHTGSSGTTKSGVKAGDSAFQLDEEAAESLKRYDHLEINDPGREEYVIISGVAAGKVTIQGNLLFSHGQGTNVIPVTLGLPESATTRLAWGASEADVCIELESVEGLRGAIGQDADSESDAKPIIIGIGPFSTGSSEQIVKDLDDGEVAEDLRRAFEKHGFPLPKNNKRIIVKSQEEGSKWLVTDTANKRRYRVLLNDEGRLTIYPDNAEYQLISSISIPQPSEDLVLAWEYWNGKGWVALPGLRDSTDRLSISGEIEFTCPADITTVEVIGQENYWIRTRIITGDYGKEEFSFTLNNKTGEVTSTPNFHPPFVGGLKVYYDPALIPLDKSLTYNNLEYQDRTVLRKPATGSSKPFVPLDDQYQALYLGFDRAPLKGPISIFFSLREQAYTEGYWPRLEWEYSRRREGQEQGDWARLEIQDETRNLTQSGTVQFIGPQDFAQLSRFGRELFWIRAVDVENKFEPTGPEPGSELRAVTREVFCPRFSGTRPEGDRAPAPKVKGIHLNTAWAIQAETITDEILGSGTGEAGQAFTLAKAPVIEEEIWVDELGALSEAGRKALKEAGGIHVDPREDEEGNALAFWVRWGAIDDLGEAQETDRAYEIDRTFGRILFGDGVHGMALPIGRNNVRATYQAGGGANGNVGAGQITALRTTIPRVDGVTNPEPAGGGSDTESVERALERGPQTIKNRGRAVTLEDFEWIAREASRSIARVKVLPNFNDGGEYETNWVTVIIVPNSAEPRPTPSPQLRQRVQNYLQERAANVVVFPGHVQVAGPTYVEVNVAAELFPTSLDRAPQVEADAFRQLGKLLHPLTGGFDGRGWEFGRLPCFSDFYGLLEAIEGVDHVRILSISLQVMDPVGTPMGAPQEFTEQRPLPASMPEYALIFSGDHKITVK